MYAKLRPLPLALAVVDKAIFNLSNQWLAGLQPQLMLETGPDGQIRVSSSVVAGDTPTHSKLVLRRHAEEAEAGVNPHYQAGDAGLRPRCPAVMALPNTDAVSVVKLPEQLQLQEQPIKL